MRKSFNKKNLSEQIILYYMFLFLVIFIICIGTYLFSSRRQIETIENNSLEYGIQIAHSNMKILTENANNCSKSIAYSDIIQKAFSGKEAIGYCLLYTSSGIHGPTDSGKHWTWLPAACWKPSPQNDRTGQMPYQSGLRPVPSAWRRQW